MSRLIGQIQEIIYACSWAVLNGCLMDQQYQTSRNDPGNRNVREAISHLFPLPSVA